ncbi:hypothetical protein PR048_031438 [Dryococelus australis]|uniref:Uncharacterized protein n=1 Tax=Dryococelus australis TaxID=614101 RepID=A0ABQ9G593_9NEOP|nr:hypothetical protein PR048_031438 [Dryococelus australis]
MIPTCENPLTRPGIEPGSPWWKASRLTAQPPWPHRSFTVTSNFSGALLKFCFYDITPLHLTKVGAAVAERLDCSPPTKAFNPRCDETAAGSMRFSLQEVVSSCSATWTRFSLHPHSFSYLVLHLLEGPRWPELLTCSSPTKTIRVQSPAGPLSNCAGRCPWSAGFLGDLPFTPPFHSGAAPYSPQSPSSALKTTLLGAARISSISLHLLIEISNRQFRWFEMNFISISSPALNSNGATVICADLRSDLGSRPDGTGDPGVNPPASGIAQHYPHVGKSGRRSRREYSPAVADRQRSIMVRGIENYSTLVQNHDCCTFAYHENGTFNITDVARLDLVGGGMSSRRGATAAPRGDVTCSGRRSEGPIARRGQRSVKLVDAVTRAQRRGGSHFLVLVVVAGEYWQPWLAGGRRPRPHVPTPPFLVRLSLIAPARVLSAEVQISQANRFQNVLERHEHPSYTVALHSDSSSYTRHNSSSTIVRITLRLQYRAYSAHCCQIASAL